MSRPRALTHDARGRWFETSRAPMGRKCPHQPSLPGGFGNPCQLLDLGRGEEGLDDRLAAGVVDRLRLLAPHKRKVLLTGEESCSGGRHPLNGYSQAAAFPVTHRRWSSAISIGCRDRSNAARRRTTACEPNLLSAKACTFPPAPGRFGEATPSSVARTSTVPVSTISAPT